MTVINVLPANENEKIHLTSHFTYKLNIFVKFEKARRYTYDRKAFLTFIELNNSSNKLCVKSVLS